MHDQGLPTTIAPQNYRAAIVQCEMGTQMSTFDWRSSDDYYDQAQKAEMTGLAWECLRRNPAFQSDHRSMSASITVTAEFRQRWGLVFRS
jgi:hypothetical protein